MAAVPADYAALINPTPDDAASRQRGQALYVAHCAACHGDTGWGDGPAAANLDPRPAPLAHTAPMLSDGYLYYRISEGGAFAPFNSAMPAWKGQLTEADRWDLINYLRALGANASVEGGPMNCCGSMSWMMVPGMLLAVALVIGAIAALAVFIVWTLRKSRPAGAPERPLDVLQRRYAAGEIDAEQFERIKRDLEE